FRLPRPPRFGHRGAAQPSRSLAQGAQRVVRVHRQPADGRVVSRERDQRKGLISSSFRASFVAGAVAVVFRLDGRLISRSSPVINRLTESASPTPIVALIRRISGRYQS